MRQRGDSAYRSLFPRQTRPKNRRLHRIPLRWAPPELPRLQEIICETRQNLFIRHLIAEIPSYSTSRLMPSADDFVIKDTQEKARKENLGLHTLLVECLTSEIFRRK